jgi:hypothetical protein
VPTPLGLVLRSFCCDLTTDVKTGMMLVSCLCLLLAMLDSSDGIMCFGCDVSSNRACGDWFNVTAAKEKGWSCAGQACFVSKGQSHDGYQYVARGCLATSRSKECVSVDVSFVSGFGCTCTTDWCNSGWHPLPHRTLYSAAVVYCLSVINRYIIR